MKALLVGVVLSLAASPEQEGHIWREPFRATFPVKVLHPPDSPAQLVPPATLTAIGGAPGLIVGLRVGGARVIDAHGLLLRFAAGPFPDGMITVRLRRSSGPPGMLPRLVPPHSLIPELSSPPRLPLSFEQIPDDPPFGWMAIRRNTRLVVTIERVSAAGGTIVFDNPTSREQLWEAIFGRPPGR